MEVVPFYYDLNGVVLVCGDGPELLLYSGSDGKPLWKHFCDGILVGVGVAADQVYVVDSDGRVTFFRSGDGQVLSEATVDGPVHDVVAHTSGRFAILTEHQVQLVAAKGPYGQLAVRQPTAVGFDANGDGVAIGNAAGELLVLIPEAEERAAPLMLGESVTGVVWSSRGFWIVAAGQRLAKVERAGTAIVGELASVTSPVRRLVISNDGSVVAALLGDDQIVLFEMQNGRGTGSIQFRRRVYSLCFGPGCLLGVGLDEGDATRIDLLTGGGIRTEPHRGRGRNVWNFESSIDHASIRGAIATGRAGGSPIAEFVYRDDDDGKGRRWLYIAAASLMLGFICCGCGGTYTYLRMYGYI